MSSPTKASAYWLTISVQLVASGYSRKTQQANSLCFLNSKCSSTLASTSTEREWEIRESWENGFFKWRIELQKVEFPPIFCEKERKVVSGITQHSSTVLDTTHDDAKILQRFANWTSSLLCYWFLNRKMFLRNHFNKLYTHKKTSWWRMKPVVMWHHLFEGVVFVLTFAL